MPDLINNAMHYNVRPSEMLGLDNDYEAYCFDEVARVLYVHALDKDGHPDFDKFYKPEKSNKDFAEFIKAQR